MGLPFVPTRGNPLTTALGASANPLAVPPPSGSALASLLGSPPNPFATRAPAGSLLTGLLDWPSSPLTAPAGVGHNSGALPAGEVPTHQWFYLRRRFGQFLDNLAITDRQLEDGEKSQAGVRACLNRHYWGLSSETANSMLIGSWGKWTRVRPPGDIDILFLLPPTVYHRFQSRTGNRQSDLLQEVRNVLFSTYSQTTMSGDGQVVSVPFNNVPIEMVPGFRCQDGSIIVCDTNNGGSYRTSTAEAEQRELSESDAAWSGNTRALARMMKQWQRVRNVPLKSFHLERLAIEFLVTWPFSSRDLFWYDWMVRDFLAYLISRANGYLSLPGTSEVVFLGSEWRSRAQTAYQKAISACVNEQNNYQAVAGSEWQDIFDTAVPVLL
jgi:hypothetical protein